MSPSPLEHPVAVIHGDLPKSPAEWADSDQVTQFDSILADGGLRRHAALAGLGDQECTRVESRRVMAAVSQLAVTGVPVTAAVAGSGCIQLRHAEIDGAREHRGSMVVASGACRMLVDFNRVTECWVTRAHGVWGDIARAAHREWEYLMESVAA